MTKLKLFALNSSKDFGSQIADHLEIPLSKHDEYYFDDKESYCASLENVRGCDVFVIQSLYSDEKESVSDKLIKLMIMLGSLHDASAKRVTAVCPQLSFGRSDRKISSRAPITTKYLSRMFKSMWTDRLLTLDVHSPTAVQNASNMHVDLIESKNLMARWVSENMSLENLVVLSPDSGGLSRANRFRETIMDLYDVKDLGIACMYKTHEGNSIKGHGIMGDVNGKNVIIYDDILASGKTIYECVEVVKKNGARDVSVSVVHGLFVGKANEHLDHKSLKNIVVTDTVKPFRLTNENILKKLHIINTTKLFAESIIRIHQDKSISDLIKHFS